MGAVADHLVKLDELSHRLATLGGARPAVWTYPETATRLPHYPSPPCFDRRMGPGGAQMLQDRAKAAAKVVPSGATLWREVLVCDAEAWRHGQGASLRPLADRLGIVGEQLAEPLPDVPPNARARIAAKVQRAERVHRGKVVATLLFRLALERGAWRMLAPTLQRFAQLAGSDAPARYESAPLGPDDVTAWFSRCPAAALSYVNLWQPGLASVVDDQTFATLLGRVGELALPLRRIDRYLTDAAQHARPISLAVALAYARRTDHTGGLSEPARQVRRALMRPDAVLFGTGAHLAQVLGAPDENLARGWAARLFAAGLDDVAAPGTSALVLLLAELVTHADPKVLAQYQTVFGPRLRTPYLALPLARALLRLGELRLATRALEQGELIGDDEEAAVLNLALDAALEASDWSCFARLQALVQATELRYTMAIRTAERARASILAERAPTPTPGKGSPALSYETPTFEDDDGEASDSEDLVRHRAPRARIGHIA